MAKYGENEHGLNSPAPGRPVDPLGNPLPLKGMDKLYYPPGSYDKSPSSFPLMTQQSSRTMTDPRPTKGFQIIYDRGDKLLDGGTYPSEAIAHQLLFAMGIESNSSRIDPKKAMKTAGGKRIIPPVKILEKEIDDDKFWLSVKKDKKGKYSWQIYENSNEFYDSMDSKMRSHVKSMDYTHIIPDDFTEFAYSADKISGGRIRKPVRLPGLDGLWVNVGGSSGGGRGTFQKNMVQVIPKEEFKGKIKPKQTSYGDWGYYGTPVSFGGKNYVLGSDLIVDDTDVIKNGDDSESKQKFYESIPGFSDFAPTSEGIYQFAEVNGKQNQSRPTEASVIKRMQYDGKETNDAAYHINPMFRTSEYFTHPDFFSDKAKRNTTPTILRNKNQDGETRWFWGDGNGRGADFDGLVETLAEDGLDLKSLFDNGISIIYDGDVPTNTVLEFGSAMGDVVHPSALGVPLGALSRVNKVLKTDSVDDEMLGDTSGLSDVGVRNKKSAIAKKNFKENFVNAQMTDDNRVYAYSAHTPGLSDPPQFIDNPDDPELASWGLHAYEEISPKMLDLVYKTRFDARIPGSSVVSAHDKNSGYTHESGSTTSANHRELFSLTGFTSIKPIDYLPSNIVAQRSHWYEGKDRMYPSGEVKIQTVGDKSVFNELDLDNWMKTADLKGWNIWKRSPQYRSDLRDSLISRDSFKIGIGLDRLWANEGKIQYRRNIGDTTYISRKMPVVFKRQQAARLIADFQRAQGIPTRTIKVAKGYVNLSRKGIPAKFYMRRVQT